MTRNEMLRLRQTLEAAGKEVMLCVPTESRRRLLSAVDESLQALHMYYREVSELAVDKLLKELYGEAME